MSKLHLFPISVVLRIMDKNGVSTCLIDGVIHDLLLKNVTFPAKFGASGECDIGGR